MQKEEAQKESMQDVPKSNMEVGTVKFFNIAKGFGFIKQESGRDLFFHVSEISGAEPKDGDNVEFQVGQGRKGPCAMKVKVLNS